MVPLDPEELAAGRRRFRFRAAIAALLAALMVASMVLPHVAVQAATVVPGRSLIAASNFFLNAQAGADGFAGAVSVTAVTVALNTTYLGLALQQAGLLLAAVSFWGLIPEDVGRWLRRFAMVGGVALVLGASTTVLGYLQLSNAGVPSLVGVAWVPTLIAGLILVVGARAARRRVVSTWFLDRPDLVQP
jgi:hypothetical protein